MKLSKYTVFHVENGKEYIYNQVSKALLEIDGELSAVLKAGDLNVIPDAIIKNLCDNGFLVEDGTCESDNICYANIRNRYNSKSMRITILPTLNCNFKCWYCYEEHRPKYLSEENTQAIFQFIKSEVTEKHLEKVVLDWFGGEPLMRFKQIIYPMSKKLKDWCEKQDVAFANMITTNGSLVDEDMARLMNEIKLNQLQITLDGGKEQHNKVKNSPAIENAYDLIVRNIHTLCRNIDDAHIELRINYTRENIDSAFEILDDFDEDVKRNILVSPHIIWQVHDSSDELSPKVSRLMEEALEKGYSIRRDSLSPRCTTCYTDNMEQFVVNYDLNVYKCTARDFNGKYSIGKITADGRFEPNSLYYKYYITPSPFMREKCLECELLPTCLYSLSCIQKKIEGVSPDCNKASILESLKKSLSHKILRP